MAGLMVGFLSTLVCLNEAEFQAAGSVLELGNIDRRGCSACLMSWAEPKDWPRSWTRRRPPVALFGAAVTCNLELTADPVAAP